MSMRVRRSTRVRGARIAAGVGAVGAIQPLERPCASGGATNSPHGVKRKIDTCYGPDSVGQWASTELQQETFSFLWSIQDYVAMSSGGGDQEVEIKSPIFKGGPKSNHKWNLMLCPNEKIDGVEYFAVYLFLKGFGDGAYTADRTVKVRSQISLLDPEFRLLEQKGGPTTNGFDEYKINDHWGYTEFLKTTDIIDPRRRFIEDGTLRIRCQVWIHGDLRHRVRKSEEALTNDASEIKQRRHVRLYWDMKELLSDSKFADLALSTSTKTFMVHKAILSARSSVFHAMLNSNMLESTQNTIDIPDFEEDVVNAMLEYIYTGETPDLNEKAVDLMQIAEKYDLTELKEDCEVAIAKNLSLENAAEVLVLAHLHNAVTLKGKVMDFINRNKEDVKKTASFLEVVKSNPAVLLDLYLSK